MNTPAPARLPLLLACAASFLALLDVTIANLAVPDLAVDFDAGVGSLSWVVTLYTILFAALLAPAGRLADVVGRKPLFVAGVATFTAASLLAAVAPTFALLLTARAVQGVGAALMMPASLAFVLVDTPPERRPAAIGLWSASAALVAAAGPALGGVLVDAFGWRALFCINVPLGAWLAYRSWRLQTSADHAGGRLPDAAGTVLLIAAVSLLVLALTEAQTWGWGDRATIACLVAAGVASAAALARSARHPSPAVEVGLWRNPTYAAANVVSVLFGVGLFASLLVGVLFLVDVWGYSELDAGLAMTPGAVAAGAVGIAIGHLARKPTPRALAVIGSLVIAASAAALALWLPSDPHFLSAWLPGGLGLGVGVGAVSVGVSSAAALSVAQKRFAAATGLNIAARQLGGALGVAILAAVLDGHTRADGAAPFLTVYWVIAATALGAALAGLRLRLAPTPARTSPTTTPATAHAS